MNNSVKPRYKTVYRKAVVYVRADIEFTDENELAEKIADFETNVCLDLDNAPSGYFDYEFSYDGLSEVDEDDVPDYLFDD
ncbi:MAG: hypothetical protein II968_00725 [Selenomonadaceae bacterium]|nr:hypothetical protein [Selenomonadaceae bacterium]MBR0287439.1 hypothetical protein [Selenomonadaceae bacterium]